MIVLVADDSAVARLTIARRLKPRGIAIVECDSASTASAVDPSGLMCAILDLDLGDGDGADVATTLRVLRADLPIAFFSGGASAATMTRARKMGPLFAKPEELDDVIAWVFSIGS